MSFRYQTSELEHNAHVLLWPWSFKGFKVTYMETGKHGHVVSSYCSFKTGFK